MNTFIYQVAIFYMKKLCQFSIYLALLIQGWCFCSASPTTQPVGEVCYKPTKDDLAHGKLQTEQMLHDLPAMKQWLTKGNPFYDFAVEHYAADAKGNSIFWVPFVEDGWKTDGCNAISVSAKDDVCGSISIRKFDCKTNRAFLAEELWFCFIFESFNTFNGHRFNKIKSEARAGKMTREQFILSSCNDEYLNAKQTKKYYLDYVIPWSKQTGIKTNGTRWFFNIPQTFEQYMKFYQDRNKYPWSFYGKYYDESIVSKK